MFRRVGLVGIAVVAMLAQGSIAEAQPRDRPRQFTNSIDMRFVWIAPGTFLMGSSLQEKGRGDDEIQRKVTFTKGFYLGAHLVTQEQWQAAMGENPSHFKGQTNRPVEQVSWNDCQGFCRTLSQKEKRAYRLPTEAEWEYSCRAGTSTPFHFGATISTEQANFNGNFVYGPGQKGLYREMTTPIGSFPANAWGLHDMHGNVWQWCQDWHGGYSTKDIVNPQGPKSGANRILRGGSWGNHPIFCRAANRNFSDPANRTEYYGLRVCMSIE